MKHLVSIFSCFIEKSLVVATKNDHYNIALLIFTPGFRNYFSCILFISYKIHFLTYNFFSYKSSVWGKITQNQGYLFKRICPTLILYKEKSI